MIRQKESKKKERKAEKLLPLFLFEQIADIDNVHGTSTHPFDAISTQSAFLYL